MQGVVADIWAQSILHGGLCHERGSSTFPVLISAPMVQWAGRHHEYVLELFTPTKRSHEYKEYFRVLVAVSCLEKHPRWTRSVFDFASMYPVYLAISCAAYLFVRQVLA